MLQHVVLFRFPSPPDVAELREQVAKFRAIDEASNVRLGSPLMPDWAAGYQFLLYLELPDQSAFTTYLSHPVHVAFGEWVQALHAETAVFTYALDDQTLLAGR
jgi:hypothetical protein